ncbi:MAG: DUF6691 family protein [Kofleriaceae bacterium]
MKAVAALVAGVVFALGLIISGMTMPSKIIGFLDVTDWDPALAIGMATAVTIYAPVAWLARQRSRPLFEPRFRVPTSTAIDPRLVAGAVIFGVGWGIGGYCPGPALVSVTTGVSAVVFVAAMIAGIAIARVVTRARG